MAVFDGYTDARESTRRLIESAFDPGDQWFVTGDILRVDAEGNHWFVDRAVDMVRTQQGPVATVQVEDILYELPAIRQAAVYGAQLPDVQGEVPVAALVLRPDDELDVASLSRLANRRLREHARPAFVRIVQEIPLTRGHRPRKQPLKVQGLNPTEPGLLRYEPSLQRYMVASASASLQPEAAEDAG
jgi:fatty-acyl-CoA synthase